MNQVILVGRVVENPILEEKEDKKVAIVKLSVPRPFKNSYGEYDSDIIDCVLWNLIAENTVDYVTEGNVIGIKGRLAHLENEEKTIVIAEKVTFLSNGGMKND